MQNRELKRQQEKIEALFQKISTQSGDIEMMSHWARYLCVQCAGFVENAIEELFGTYSRTKANIEVTNFVLSKLDRVQTPKMHNILVVAAAFSPTWHDEIERFSVENGRKEAIDSLMNDRHHIAHGGSSAITFARVKDYWEKTLEVIDFIESQLSQ